MNRKKINLEFEFGFSKWKIVLSTAGDILTLLWKGEGCVLGALLALTEHWVWIVPLLVWLMFDVKVEIKEK